MPIHWRMRFTSVVEHHEDRIGRVADHREPAMREHDRVELVAMQNQQLAPVRRGVDHLAADLDAAEVEPAVNWRQISS